MPDTSNLFDLKATMRVVHAATAYTQRYVPGMSIDQVGPLRHVHYDKPLWWNSDYFQAIEVQPEEAVQTIQDFHPGPHILGVITADTAAAISSYTALGYKPMQGKAEPLMTKRLEESASERAHYLVQQVETEDQRIFFNSVIDADDPHGQMQPQELLDINLRFYFVEQDDQCVCTGKAIQPFAGAVVVEPLVTDEAYRRRGIASALMNQVHADAIEKGAMECVIMASPMGELLYSTLGYEVVGYHQSFVLKDD